MKKNKQYEAYKNINRETYINSFIQKYENFTNTIFKYENLPKTLKPDFIEKQLFYFGNVYFYKIPSTKNMNGGTSEGGVYAFKANLGGVLDNNDFPTKVIINSPYLYINKEINIEDGVLMKNSKTMLPTVTTINKYAVYMYDNEMSLNLNIILSRVPYIISASDDSTKESALQFVQSIVNGDYKIIGESAFLDGVKISTTPQTTNTIENYIEALQYYKASLMHELGVNANYNMKREALNRSEIDVNVDALKPIINDMYNHRLEAIEELNSKYGLNIELSINSPWDFGLNESDDNESESDDNESESDDNESESDDNESESDDNESESDDNESESNDNESESNDKEGDKS